MHLLIHSDVWLWWLPICWMVFIFQAVSLVKCVCFHPSHRIKSSDVIFFFPSGQQITWKKRAMHWSYVLPAITIYIWSQLQHIGLCCCPKALKNRSVWATQLHWMTGYFIPQKWMHISHKSNVITRSYFNVSSYRLVFVLIHLLVIVYKPLHDFAPDWLRNAFGLWRS